MIVVRLIVEVTARHDVLVDAATKGAAKRKARQMVQRWQREIAQPDEDFEITVKEPADG